MRAILSDSSHKKLSRDNALRALLAAAANKLSLSSKDGSSHIPPSSLVTSTFWSMCGQQLQALALENGLRYTHCDVLCICRMCTGRSPAMRVKYACGEQG